MFIFPHKRVIETDSYSGLFLKRFVQVQKNCTGLGPNIAFSCSKAENSPSGNFYTFLTLFNWKDKPVNKTLKQSLVRGHKCLKNFKLTCIICNVKKSNYVSGETFVVCVSLALVFLWSSFTLHVQSFSKLRSVLPLSSHRLQNILKLEVWNCFYVC